ncbi:mitochondrial fission ELM1 family protein [Luteolibacter flavescens]|uniref:Mitochondrial fission ELM1 family protein n=1 Tax=Luteolibacter flavescens TaxID=1859460 RepID=A0ABT3FJH8_9BACT|nr:mitochondrial fission ELM1 family protein [Luteolibacter flavescens]MCW1883612.1 mitochondrial fission ELM1 family protein [Luteolibacter flavescens]
MTPLEIHVLSDGKPGHENQSYGLAEAIGRIRPVTTAKISLAGVRGPIARLKKTFKESGHLPKPQLLIGAGHAVHTSLLALSKKLNVPCVLMMKPTFPAALFDLCLIPEHDLEGRAPQDHVIPTTGALNRVPPPDGRQRQGGLILLGGPSSSHGWDAASVEAAICQIVAAGKDRPWRITNSRRSPAGSLDALAKACPALATYPHGDTGRDWLPQMLAEAAEVWVTEDSISMIYEALSSGARVGLLPVPAIKKAGRVARGVQRLAEQGFVTRFSYWSPATGLAAPPRILREADRCAAIVLQRLFPTPA